MIKKIVFIVMAVLLTGALFLVPLPIEFKN